MRVVDFILGFSLFLLPLSTAAREASVEVALLEVGGDVETALRLNADNLLAMPRGTVRTTSDGLETKYEGVFLHELLRRAGVPLGEALRGKAVASYVVAEAEDGYQAVYSLAELDPMFLDNSVLVADSANGKPLFGRDGKLRIVAPKEGREARSVRMLKRLTVVRLRK